jgi:LAO/AO transport system kinase
LAGTGDELQGIKRGIMEMADGIVINKADGDNIEKAKMAQRQLKNALHLYPLPESGWSPEVLTYSGYYGIGIEEVWDMIHRYIDFVKQNGYFERRRNEQAKYWMYETINERLKNDFYRDKEIEKLLPQLEEEVLSARKSSFVAANQALQQYYRRRNKI